MKACVVGSEYALPLAIQSVTGCRAAELELGVKVRWQQGQLEFEIRGAKYVEGRQGQEWRKIVVPVEGVDTQIVQEALRRQGEPVLVQVHAAKGLSWAASYFGRKALGIRVTGHMFRHQLGADLKAEGFDSFDLAAALGQLTTKTSGIYGRPRDAKGTKRRMTAKAASAVRDTATYKSEGPRRQHDPVVKRP